MGHSPVPMLPVPIPNVTYSVTQGRLHCVSPQCVQCFIIAHANVTKCHSPVPMLPYHVSLPCETSLIPRLTSSHHTRKSLGTRLLCNSLCQCYLQCATPRCPRAILPGNQAAPENKNSTSVTTGLHVKLDQFSPHSSPTAWEDNQDCHTVKSTKWLATDSMQTGTVKGSMWLAGAVALTSITAIVWFTPVLQSFCKNYQLSVL